MENIETTVSISVRPPKEISDVVMEVKKSMGVYYPDHEESVPHTTLYSPRFDEGKYQQLLNELKTIDTPTFIAEVGQLVFEEQPLRNTTFVYLSYSNSEKFIDLHKKVLAIANPLRGDLIRHKDVQRYKNGKMTEEGWERTCKYGFQYLMDKYNPHITIGVIELNNQGKMIELKDRLRSLEGKSFIVDKILVKFKRKNLSDKETILESENTKIVLK